MNTFITGWAAAVGSRTIPVQHLEAEFGLPDGKLRTAAGIESVTRVAPGQDEASLGAAAADQALAQAGLTIGEVDCLVATTETLVGYPSLAALLHARLLADELCGATDVGGACMGLLNALALARGLLSSGSARRVLVVTADVHSRRLTPQRVPGTFGGLFGDGASAFVLSPAAASGDGLAYRLGEMLSGCSAGAADAFRLSIADADRIALTFEGETLARVAVDRLEQIIADLELRSGCPRASVEAFATHQPNPRLVELLARQCRVPREKFPPVARTCGNLGSSTCGVALSHALADLAPRPKPQRGPVFLAAVAPGLLWGGVALHHA
jgi:3-oxoacyl-[acyl-carrier-protein] synthase-3